MRVIQTASATRSTRYFLTDHLGSISVLTDENGLVVERLSFDAWGKRRNPNGTDDATGSITSQTTRGFTGEEELSVGSLVHLNGRVYDALLARFTSADPTVTDPMNMQGWNRYSYVGNDPLAFTDPNGFSWLSSFFHSVGNFFNSIGHFISQNWRSIVQIAVNVALQAVGVPYFLAAAASAALGTGLSGGNLGQMLKSAAIAAATAVAFNAIGPVPAFAKAPSEYLLKVGENALVGCASSVASGGSCGSGAASAAVSAGLSPYLPNDLIGGTIARATAGGLASVAGGGKFANGAVTGAFQYLATRSLETAQQSREENLMNANNACASGDACAPGSSGYLQGFPPALQLGITHVGEMIYESGNADWKQRFDNWQVSYEDKMVPGVYGETSYSRQSTTFLRTSMLNNQAETDFLVAQNLAICFLKMMRSLQTPGLEYSVV